MGKKEEQHTTWTDRMTALIPKSNVDLYLTIYREMININFHKIANSYPREIVADIENHILQLEAIGWLDKDDSDRLIEALNFCMFMSNDGRNMRAAAAPVMRGKRGAPRDHAFAFLIFAVIEDLKYFTGRPHYDLVSDFLSEQKIIPPSKDLDANDLQKRYRKLDITDILKPFFYSSYVSDEINQIYRQLHAPGVHEGFFRTLADALRCLEEVGEQEANQKTFPVIT
jgi:hypothetical protein